MAAPTEDVNTALIAQLLGAAPGEEQIQTLRDTKAGALSKVQEAYKRPSTPEGYSPFQDMVANYVKTMVPGWSQMGLGAAVAAPYFRNLEEAKTQRLGEIESAKGELGDAQKDLTNELLLARSGIGAGAGLARQAAIGGRGMDYMQVRQPDGSVLLVNKKDPTQREVIPASETKQFDTLVEKGIVLAKERGHENPTEWAIDNAYYILKQRPKGIAPANAVQTPSVPIAASSGKDFTPTGVPATPASATAAAPATSTAPQDILDAMPGIPDGPAASGSEMSSAPGFSLNWATLPPAAKDEAIRILNRADAQPDNIALQRNSTKALADLATRFGGSKPSVSAVPATPAETPSAAPTVPTPSVAKGPVPLPLEGMRNVEAMKQQGKQETESLGKEYENLNKVASSAGQMRVQLGVLRDLYSNPNMPQGEQAELIQKIRSSLNSVGVPVAPETAAADLAKAIATKFALQSRTADGTNLLPGAMSNYEDQLLQKMAPVLSLTQPGRMALIDYMDEIAKSNQRVAHEANVFAGAKGNRLTPEWNQRRERVVKEEMARMTVRFNEIMKQFGGK